MAAPWLRVGEGHLDVMVRVVPRASRSAVAGAAGDRLRVQVTAPPVDGEANEAVLEVVARAAGLRPSAASLEAGATGRAKTVRLRCDEPAEAARRLEAAAAR